MRRREFIAGLGGAAVAWPEAAWAQQGETAVRSGFGQLAGLATSESWRDKQTGERRERTEWHRVVIFNENLAKVAEQYLKKGSKVYVEGQLQTRKWTDQQGQDRYSTEVVLQGFSCTLTLLDSPGGARSSPEGQSNGRQPAVAQTRQPALLGNDMNDPLPF